MSSPVLRRVRLQRQRRLHAVHAGTPPLALMGVLLLVACLGLIVAQLAVAEESGAAPAAVMTDGRGR